MPFLEKLREYVQAGLKDLKLGAVVEDFRGGSVQIKEEDYKAKGWVPILSIKHKNCGRQSERSVLYEGRSEKQQTYLGGKCHGSSRY